MLGQHPPFGFLLQSESSAKGQYPLFINVQQMKTASAHWERLPKSRTRPRESKLFSLQWRLSCRHVLGRIARNLWVPALRVRQRFATLALLVLGFVLCGSTAILPMFL